jgi:hypothetical protein
MANVNAPMGFMPVRHINGGLVRSNPYAITDAYATSLYTGDAVVITSGALAIGAENSALLVGVFAGCQFLDSSGVPGARFSPYWPASTATTGAVGAIAWVWDDPGTIFRAQCSVGTAFAKATHIGGSYDLITTNAGSTLTGQSGMEVNLGDTGTGQFLVMRLIEEPGNAVGTNAKVEVIIRKHLWKGN